MIHLPLSIMARIREVDKYGGRKMKKHLRIIAFIISIVCIFGICASATAMNKDQLNTVTGSIELYNKLEDKDSIAGRYELIEKTTQGLSKYSDLIKSKNEELCRYELKDIITTITFSEYLSFEKLEKYVDQYSVDAVLLQLRAVDCDGNIMTIYTRTDMGLKETERFLKDQAQHDMYSIIGITSLYSLVDSERLKELESDPFTYLADTSGDNVFWGKTRTRNLIATNKLGLIDYFPHSLAWDLETLNIINTDVLENY